MWRFRYGLTLLLPLVAGLAGQRGDPPLLMGAC
jgi:hypothetical protein